MGRGEWGVGAKERGERDVGALRRSRAAEDPRFDSTAIPVLLRFHSSSPYKTYKELYPALAPIYHRRA